MTEVVAAVIVEGKRVLVARRGNGAHKGLWEFPGGKVEAGERPTAALVREIDEEFQIRIAVGEFIQTVPFEVRGRSFRLLAYFARQTGGILSLQEHEEVRWVSFDELRSLDLAPADVPIAERLRHY